MDRLEGPRGRCGPLWGIGPAHCLVGRQGDSSGGHEADVSIGHSRGGPEWGHSRRAGPPLDSTLGDTAGPLAFYVVLIGTDVLGVLQPR